MEQVRVYYDVAGRTLTVRWGDPRSEDVCEEAEDDTILMKNGQGEVIGFEKLNVSLVPGSLGLSVEIVNLPGTAA